MTDVNPSSLTVNELPSQDHAPSAPNTSLRQTFRQFAAAPKPEVLDITEKFTQACNALEVGQLVKDEYFTLFESIGAIEIMDSKMDSGFLQPGETLEDDYDTLMPLLPEELIGIMDQLLCYEMAWHTGYPLSQTLFTSVYIDKLLWPETKILEQAQFYRGDVPLIDMPTPLLQALRAYCLALIKSCDYVIGKITTRDYYEEEDFCTYTYNRALFVNVPLDVFLGELDAATQIVDNVVGNAALKTALLARIECRRNLLRALDLDISLTQASYSWPPVMDSLSIVENTHQLGQTVPGAFSTKIQRRLASTVPPRPIVEIDFKDALDKLQQLCIDCQEATGLINLPRDALEYQSFVWFFSARSPPPLTYSRAYLACMLFDPNILQSGVSLPLKDMSALVFPASPVVDPINWTLSPPLNQILSKPPRLQLAELIDRSVERCGPPYMDFWVALGQNRCRLRRMLTHVIVEWDILQADASLVDSEIVRILEEIGMVKQPLDYPVSTWVYHKKLWIIERIVLLSFEQEIYFPDEYAGMYLYLSLIALRRKELLKRVETHYNTWRQQLLAQCRLREAREVDAAAVYLDSLLTEAEGISSLGLGLARFYILSLYLNLLPRPKRPSTGESLCYELRMKPFLTLQPPEAPPFEDFKANIRPYGEYCLPDPSFLGDLLNPDSELWIGIDSSIKEAKNAFGDLKKLGPVAAKAEGVSQAWKKEVQSVLASCVALGVAVAVVKDAVFARGVNVEQHLGIRMEIPGAGSGKRYAEGWIAVKVTKL